MVFRSFEIFWLHYEFASFEANLVPLILLFCKIDAEMGSLFKSWIPCFPTLLISRGLELISKNSHQWPCWLLNSGIWSPHTCKLPRLGNDALIIKISFFVLNNFSPLLKRRMIPEWRRKERSGWWANRHLSVSRFSDKFCLRMGRMACKIDGRPVLQGWQLQANPSLTLWVHNLLSIY